MTTRENLRALTCETLRLRLAQVHLSQAGKKEVLVERDAINLLRYTSAQLFEYVNKIHDTSFTFLATYYIITGQN